MTSPPPLATEKISVRRSGRAILSDISLTLPAGSMTVLLGPNGSGKTTLIRALAGIVEVSAGGVFLGDAPLRNMTRSAVARQCAYLPQHASTNFDIRVEDAVALGRYPHIGSWGALKSADFERIHWALERVGLTALKQRVLPTLSGGERQRVFIARALAQEASILLLDEPISALDINWQLELMALLQDLHRDGLTILTALHDLRSALDFFPRALLLDGGRLTAAGATRELIFGEPLQRAFGVQAIEAQQVAFRATSAK